MVLRHQASGAQQQDFEQRQFARREFDDFAVEAGHALGLVVGQGADFDARRIAGTAPGQRPRPREQLRQGKRLGQVVVGAGIEPAYPVVDAILGGQHQYRHRQLARAQALEHIDAGQARQAEVEDQQVVLLREQGGVGIRAVVDMVHGIAGFAQGGDQALGNDAVVFGKQDSHGGGWLVGILSGSQITAQLATDQAFGKRALTLTQNSSAFLFPAMA